MFFKVLYAIDRTHHFCIINLTYDDQSWIQMKSREKSAETLFDNSHGI